MEIVEHDPAEYYEYQGKDSSYIAWHTLLVVEHVGTAANTPKLGTIGLECPGNRGRIDCRKHQRPHKQGSQRRGVDIRRRHTHRGNAFARARRNHGHTRLRHRISQCLIAQAVGLVNGYKMRYAPLYGVGGDTVNKDSGDTVGIDRLTCPGGSKVVAGNGAICTCCMLVLSAGISELGRYYDVFSWRKGKVHSLFYRRCHPEKLVVVRGHKSLPVCSGRREIAAARSSC